MSLENQAVSEQKAVSYKLSAVSGVAGKYQPYPEYKESGVEWLGEIPAHWEELPLKYLSSCNDDVLLETTDPDFEFEYIDIGSVSAVKGIAKTESVKFGKAPSRARRVVRNGDIIVSTVRTYLEAIAPITEAHDGMVASTGFAVIRPSRLDSIFAQYALRARYFIDEVVSRSTGVSYPAINSSDLIKIFTVLPSLTEQRTIAAFLDHETARIDALIAKQQRLIALLKEKRQAVISHAVTKGLNPDTPMKDSGVEWLGQVPEHWTVTRAKMVSEIFVPQRNKPELNDSGDGVHWATMEDMKSDEINGTKKFVSKDAFEAAGSKLLKKGAVVASCVGNFGVSSVLNINVVINQQLQAYIPKTILAPYLRDVIACSKVYFDLVGTAATLVYVNQEGFGNLPIALPPTVEQKKIEQYIERSKAKLDRAIAKGLHQVELLQERRTALISAAVTGKIDVRNWSIERA